MTVRLGRVDSTQDEAIRRFRSVPVLVVADVQDLGRGRSGRRWWGADRALYTSMAFRPGWPATTRARLGLVAGLAARETLPAPVELKWPNDLMVAGAKVGGILSEASGDVVSVGLGVNLWWVDPPDGAGSLLERDPGSGTATPLAAAWGAELLRRVAAGPDAWGRAEYREACGTLGRPVTWADAGGATSRGEAVDVAEDGGLVVRTAGGLITLHSGEVHTVRAEADAAGDSATTLTGLRPTEEQDT